MILPGTVLSGRAAAATVEALAWPCPPLEVTPVLHRIAFDPETFDAASFAAAEIACPLHIGKSGRKRQAEYFHGRLCARAAMRALGRDGAVGTGAMREPIWPDGLVGSITHGAGLAASVALPSSSCRGIGVDIEQVTEDGLDALRATVVSAREYALLASLAHRIEIGVLLTLVFSAKESFFKASFASVGRYFDFGAMEVRGLDEEQGTLAFSVTSALCAAWPAGAPLAVRFALWPGGRVATLFAW
jgi:enterobactin synthetase component D